MKSSLKHLLLLFILIFINIATFAQNSNHIKFNGVPLNGSVESFSQQLKKNGFVAKGDKSNYLFTGKFANLNVAVVPNVVNGNVGAVYIQFFNGTVMTSFPTYEKAKNIIDGIIPRIEALYNCKFIEGIIAEPEVVFVSAARTDEGCLAVEIKERSSNKYILSLTIFDAINNGWNN